MTYDQIKLDKGLYTTPEGFTKALEAIDPSAQYEGTHLAGLDAFERQLKRFEIKVFGAHSDPVEKFFRSYESAALFPEFMARTAQKGFEDSDVSKYLIAVETRLKSTDYRSLAAVSIPTDTDPVLECDELPILTIINKSTLVALKKRGRLLACSYEAIRYHKLDLFSVLLRRIGAAIAQEILQDAVSVLVNGDGSANSDADAVFMSGQSLAYSDLLTLWGALDSFRLTTLLADPARIQEILSLEEMSGCAPCLDFPSSGTLVTPLGAKLIKCATLPSGSVLGLDAACALEMVHTGGIIGEHDKLIDRQLDRATLSATVGFSKIFPAATKMLLSE